jgi:(1->4)-alpha-D-glucan 1-alpha-D-glucosylmutase
VAEEIARLGAINALAQVVLKLTAPGVPDIYQGNEIWDYSLVDPDNRRPVDYQLRRAMLDALANATPEEMLRAWPDGRIKLFVTQRLLCLRRDHPELFRQGSYVPLTVTGAHADSCVAFAREHASAWLVVVVPRVSSRVGFPPLGTLWQDTSVELPEVAALGGATDVFTGRELRLEGRTLKVAEAMATFPLAVYKNAST